jgi:hypothetical protein
MYINHNIFYEYLSFVHLKESKKNIQPCVQQARVHVHNSFLIT